MDGEMACESVEKEIDKVISKFGDIRDEAICTINEIKNVLEVCKSSLGKNWKLLIKTS